MSFTGIKLPSRVDTLGGLPSFYRQRIETVTTETGSVITASYELPVACSAPVSQAPATNTTSCYPVYWTPDGYTDQYLDWFNKYAVTRVTQTDPTGGAPALSTSYTYVGGAAWRYDENEVVKAKYRTYGQFRGYGKVQVRTGDGVNDRQTLSETTYYRGMSKNNNTTVVTVSDSAGGVHEDLKQLAGSELETTQYRGDGGPIESSTITSYWVSAATATRSRSGLPALTANWVAPIKTYTRQAVTSSDPTTWRYTETDHTYNASVTSPTFGLLTHTYTHTVPADAAYDQCTTNTYAPVNSIKNLVGLLSETETVSVACGGFTEGSPASVPGSVNTLTAPTSVDRPARVVQDQRTFYDDPTFSTTFPQPAAPTKGDITMTRTAADWTGSAYTYHTTNRSTYDSSGRLVDAYDGNGNKTSTAYTMNSVGLTTAVSSTNALGHVISATLDPRRGQALTTTDPNGVVTKQQYDALGRATAVWLNSRDTSLPANYTFSYTVSKTGITATKTETLNDFSSYIVSTLIYDALLRPRQTQAMTPQDGRMVTDTFYDTRGWVRASYNGWWDSATTPNTTLVTAADLQAQVPNQTFTTYDGLGRAVIVDSAKDGVTVSTTTTVYNGDRTTVIPPTGGVVRTTVTDALGRTTGLHEYSATPTVNTPSDTFTGTFTVTGGTAVVSRYGYDGHGNQATVTDAQGNTWTSTYNLLGEVVSKNDPDAGISTMKYDAVGNLAESTDARGKTLSYTYDALNRKTGQYAAPIGSQSSTNQRAAWIYDNSNNVAGVTNATGKLTTTIAYRNGAEYTTQAKGFNVFGESLGETVTIPSTEGLLAGSYAFSHVYTSTNGLLLKDVYPNKGSLPSETVLHHYNAFDMPDTLAGIYGYSQGVTYDAYGRVNQQTIGAGSNLAYVTNTYDEHTSRLTRQLVTRAVATPSYVDQQDYRYDLAGNITSKASTRLGAATPSETQCYTYDKLARLTQAWTATDDCATTPTDSDKSMVGNAIGDGSAYWTSWTIDPLGNRAKQVEHDLGGGTDTTTTYTYDGTGAGQPHTLTSTATAGGASGSTSYAYDAAGNTITRNAGQGNQTLTWDDAGKLTDVTGGTAGDSSFVYDADGNLLLQKDPGSTTLYLPNGQQHTLNTSTQNVTGVRYYQLPGGGTCIRTGSGTNYTFALPDHQGTPSLYLDSTAQNPTWRQYTPYGAPRGAEATYPDNRGFLNKPTSPASGFTLVGARAYDPLVGRFISVDPVQDLTDPQQWNAYAYANNSPVTASDPAGLMPLECKNGGCSNYHPGDEDANNQAKDNNPCWPVACLEDSGNGGGNHGGPTDQDLKRAKEIKTQSVVSIIAKAGGQLLLDLFGITDILNCIRGDAMSCAWALVGLLPVGKAISLVKKIKPIARTLVRASRAISKWVKDVKWAEKILQRAGKCLHSFAAGTKVVMADGSTKSIEELKEGDKVLATDPETGKTEARQVTYTHINKDTDLTDVTVVPEDGGKVVLKTTQHHPFWSRNRHQWINAADLRTGEHLLTLHGSTATVKATTSYIGARIMYDLTVNTTHTYYVMAGNTPVLVHNTGGCPRNAKGQFTSGENVDAARGRLTHQNYRTALGDGYDYEYRLPSGRRPDAIDWNNRIVRELKSDAASSQATGRRQLNDYVAELEAMTGQRWTGILDTYSR